MAALTLGALTLYRARREQSLSPGDSVSILVIFSLLFLVPGALYLMLASWVARRKRWAVICSLALAMLGDTRAGYLEIDFATKFAPRGQLPEANRNRAMIAIMEKRSTP